MRMKSFDDVRETMFYYVELAKNVGNSIMKALGGDDNV